MGPTDTRDDDAAVLAGLLRGQLGLVLSDTQVGLLMERFGLPAPLGWGDTQGSHADTQDSLETLATLRELGIVRDGAVTSWFRSLWATITAPALILTVERTIEGRPVIWTYSIDQTTYAEQGKTDAGWAWICGHHYELLPRVLLNIGLLRFTKTDDAATLDPFPRATEWACSLAMVAGSRGGELVIADSARFVCAAGSWSMQSADGGVAAVTPTDVGQRVTDVLGAAAH